MIPAISDLATDEVDQPVVAMDGALEETLRVIGDHVDRHGLRCVGLIVLPNSEVAFSQNLADSVHLEDVSSIDEVVAKQPDMVVIGPSALLGGVAEYAITQRILEAHPGVRIVCATGIRTDIYPF